MKSILLSIVLSLIIAQDPIEVSPSTLDIDDPSISGCTDSAACNYNKDATEEDMIISCKLANAHDFIKKLDLKYFNNTNIPIPANI